jgi:hypothetical protein
MKYKQIQKVISLVSDEALLVSSIQRFFKRGFCFALISPSVTDVIASSTGQQVP